MKILQIDHLNYVCEGNTLLNGVSLRLREKEIVGVVGANGAGKTTLLKCLLGLISPKEGEIILKGRDLKEYTRRELAQTVGYVPQVLDPSIPFCVLDFVKMSRYAHSSSASENEKISTEALRKVSMDSFSDRYLDSLSGGERQRVSIAAALAQSPSLLILDEPSAHLDPRQCDEVHATLIKIAEEEGLAILCVTHDLNWVSVDFDFVYGMKEGAIVAAGTPVEVINQTTLQKLYGVKFPLVTHPDVKVPMVLPTPNRKES